MYSYILYFEEVLAQLTSGKEGIEQALQERAYLHQPMHAQQKSWEGL